MTDNNSEEEQDADISVDNICYAKIKLSCKSGSGKNAVEKEVVMMDESCVDSEKEQDVSTSVDNTCYEKLQSKQYLLCQENFKALNNVCINVTLVTSAMTHSKVS